MNILKNTKFIFFLKIAVAAGLLYALISFIDLKVIITAFQNARYKFLLIGFALSGALFFVQFMRWKLLILLISKEVQNKEIATSLLVGNAFGFVTPGQFGEVAGRLLAHQSLRKAHVAGVFLLDKIYVTLFTIILGIFGFRLFLIRFFSELWNPAYNFIALVSFIIALFILFQPRYIKLLQKLLPKKIREHRFFDSIEIINSSFHTTQAVTLALLTFLWFGIIILQYYFFIHAFATISLVDTLAGVGTIFFIKNILLPISIGDVGVRESASIFFFGKFGISAVAAFNAPLLTYIANNVITGIIGSLLILKLHIKTK